MELVPFSGFSNNKSILIALVPDEFSAKKVHAAYRGTSAEKLHVTLTIIEKINNKSYKNIQAFCSEVAEHFAPFSSPPGPLQKFNSSRVRSGTGDPIVLKMETQEFNIMRNAIAPLLRLYPENYDMKQYDFNPHLTVGYLPKGVTEFKAEPVPLPELRFSKLLVSHNGEDTYYDLTS